MKIVNLFVYGTLRYGNVNHHRLEEFADTRQFSTVKNFTIKYYHGLPYAVISLGNEIIGEKYKISLRCLSKLDKMEQYNKRLDFNMYRRISITDTDGDSVFLYIGAEFFELATGEVLL